MIRSKKKQFLDAHQNTPVSVYIDKAPKHNFCFISFPNSFFETRNDERIIKRVNEPFSEFILFITKKHNITLQKSEIIGAAIYLDHKAQENYDFSKIKNYSINIMKNFSVQIDTAKKFFDLSYHHPLVNMTSNTLHESKLSSRSAINQLYEERPIPNNLPDSVRN